MKRPKMHSSLLHPTTTREVVLAAMRGKDFRNPGFCSACGAVNECERWICNDRCGSCGKNAVVCAGVLVRDMFGF